ncbi:MAG: chromosomal replication initiator protein DnaA [Lachnospiraceae bacterium]|nr:chromosomal replication initiator protein DnaA [Lachnospiraceae bacterium]MEE0863341.1 chromosomal replication initiator protein DnaA [Lachnospiraceae bacterium]
MFDLINEKWDEILEILKKEHDIMDVSFNTWIKPLKIHSVENNIITLLIPDDNIGVSYLNKKYYIPLKVVIQEVTGHALDIVFSHESDLNKVEKVIASNKVVSDSLNDRKAEANINPNYTFDNFVVGGNNNFAHAYALAVAESPAEMYNPLFIYGGVGLGKTHLMHSIGNFILDKNPDAKIRCVTSEVFTNEVIGAIRSENQSSIVEFRDKYRNLDVLLIDDIQFIIGKERSQEEFFHTFNTLKESNKQIVISSDKPPKDITTLEDRLKSRFEMGLTVDISAPDYETRMAILSKKAESEGYNINEDIIKYIASNIKSNIRELEGALTKIVAFSRVSKKPVDVEFAKEVLKDIISPDVNKEITPKAIINIVAEHFNISPADIVSRKKSHNISHPRQIAMYLIRTLTDSSLQTISAALHKKDHTTVMYAIDKISNEIDCNESTKNTVDILIKKIKPN